MDHFAAQCGFCTTGMLMAAKALLGANPSPTRGDVVEAIGGQRLPLHRLRADHRSRPRCGASWEHGRLARNGPKARELTMRARRPCPLGHAGLRAGASPERVVHKGAAPGMPGGATTGRCRWSVRSASFGAVAMPNGRTEAMEFRKDLFADERDDDLNEVGQPTQRQDAQGHVTRAQPLLRRLRHAGDAAHEVRAQPPPPCAGPFSRHPRGRADARRGAHPHLRGRAQEGPYPADPPRPRPRRRTPARLRQGPLPR